MNIRSECLKSDEIVTYKLRSIYSEYGYEHYKVNKFEEYDFYVRNKTFLVSENILSFTDTNGKLMALKPDVTFSIIKNYKDGGTEKVFYNENVYRPSPDSGYFREIPQTGLECIGDIDMYSQCEVITLAAKSLEAISQDYILDIADIRFIKAMLSDSGLDDEAQDSCALLIREKNVSGIKELFRRSGGNEDICLRLCKAVSLYGNAEDTLKEMEKLVSPGGVQALEELKSIFNVLDKMGYGDKVKIDLSLTGDMNYYNGIVMNGYISGVPSVVLSGGRYDNLVRKMGKEAAAIGFAVYLDRLERYGQRKKSYDADVYLKYGQDTPCLEVSQKAAEIIKSGRTVRAGKGPAEPARYRQIIEI